MRLNRIDVIRTVLRGLSAGVEDSNSAIYDFDADRIKRIRLYIDPDEAFVVAGLRS